MINAQHIFLALDTSHEVASVALFDQDTLYFSRELPHKYAHGQGLCPALEDALAYSAAHKLTIEALFVGLGPGSFVGLRIALATALGFCFGRNMALMGFCSHEAIALSYPDLDALVLSKASGDLCYISSFKSHKYGPELTHKDNIINYLKYSNKIISNIELAIATHEIIPFLGPSPQGLQRASFAKYQRLGKIIDEINYIKPNYIKDPSVSC
jgi:tRNA threonylcarbamoyl adenosine modification protein YeaZ